MKKTGKDRGKNEEKGKNCPKTGKVQHFTEG